MRGRLYTGCSGERARDSKGAVRVLSLCSHFSLAAREASVSREAWIICLTTYSEDL